MPDQAKPEALRSVNVKMTDAMIASLKKHDTNRSRVTRLVLAAILQEFHDGNDEAFNEALAAAHRSSAKTQKMTQRDDVIWCKAIVWVPERMHIEIHNAARNYDLRPADFIRGALIGFTGEDPTKDIVVEGHELWLSDVEEEVNKAESR
ncbi:hypothetical protein KUV57_12980 [Epibacterium sp. DP7N7-1]|nr:hypothetical protein [Epibacterium sp. DP7N7-1]